MKPVAVVAWMLTVAAAAAQTQITLYSQNFAAVRERLSAPVAAGESTLRLTNITTQIEADTAMLRVAEGGDMEVLWQQADLTPFSEAALLRQFEGRTLDFQVSAGGETRVVAGRVVRAGVSASSLIPRLEEGYRSYASAAEIPLIEVDGRQQLGLPGRPLFPAGTVTTVPGPALLCRVRAAAAGPRSLDLCYLTGGLRWEALYTLILDEAKGGASLEGMATVENNSGRSYAAAAVDLAVSDLTRSRTPPRERWEGGRMIETPAPGRGAAPVFYALAAAMDLPDRTSRQVSLLNRSTAAGAAGALQYDGLRIPEQYRNWRPESIRNQAEFCAGSQPAVMSLLELTNSAGRALPPGRLRTFRQAADGRLVFLGEEAFAGLAAGAALRQPAAPEPRLTGEHRQLEFRPGNNGRQIEETFEVALKNSGAEPLAVRLIEHLYRAPQWLIAGSSQAHVPLDNQTVAFDLTVPAAGRAVVNYTVRYTW